MAEVSIILRTTTRYMLLSRAIQDITNQTYKNWKIILINDGGNKSRIERIINHYNVPENQQSQDHSFACEKDRRNDF